MYKVYKFGIHPKKKKYFYTNLFKKRSEARNFCRDRSWEIGLTIVHPDGTEEKYKECEHENE